MCCNQEKKSKTKDKLLLCLIFEHTTDKGFYKSFYFRIFIIYYFTKHNLKQFDLFEKVWFVYTLLSQPHLPPASITF